MLLQPFDHNYQSVQVKQDYEIVNKALAFAMDINEALKSEQDQIAESLVVHKTAGPPYFENEPKLPNSRPTPKPKRPKIIPKNRATIATTTQRPIVERPKKNRNLNKRIRRQRLKMKILQELRRIERIKSIKPQQPVIMEKSGNVFSILTKDQSLSSKDFAGELTKWFRRSIWFLTFTAAYTISPPLMVIAIILSLAFEFALNINSVQSAMNDFTYDILRRSDPFMADPFGYLMNSFQTPQYGNSGYGVVSPGMQYL